jgi:hypothetical protein
MSLFKKASVALAAATMTLSATVAAAAPQTLRADTAVSNDMAMGEGASAGAWIGILAIAALVGVFLFGGSQTDAPTSP